MIKLHKGQRGSELNYTRGGAHTRKELSSGGWSPCSTGFPHYVRVLGTHLYQCTSWHCCERLHSASLNFFLKMHSLISWWVIYEHTCPHHAECSPVFDQKQHDPHVPPSLLTRLPKDFLPCPEGKISPQRETFCRCGRGETKKSRSTKSIQIYKFRNCSEQWRNILIGVLHQIESALKVTEV